VVYGLCLLLAGALAMGSRGQKVQSVHDVDLAPLPRDFGPCVCLAARYMKGKQTEESSHYVMVFSNTRGQEAEVLVSSTRTRLGALRDWALARTGQGWEVGEQRVVQVERVEGVPFPLTAGVRTLSRGKEQRVSMVWFVSRDEQSPSFVQAQLAGWRDRLVGREDTWGELYIETRGQGTVEEQEAIARDLLGHLAGAFYHELFANSSE